MLFWAVRIWTWITGPVLSVWRPIRLGAHAVVLDGAGKVLLVRHTYRRGWSIPGGGVNRGETLEAAARREIYEETGVIAEGPIDLLGVYSNLTRRYSDHMTVHVIRTWRREDRKSFEIAETRFFPIDDLPADTLPGTRRRLAELTGARRQDGLW